MDRWQVEMREGLVARILGGFIKGLNIFNRREAETLAIKALVETEFSSIDAARKNLEETGS